MGCTDLENKPKLFILQACRGGERNFEGATPIPSMTGRRVHPTGADVSAIQYTMDTVDIVNGVNTGVLKLHMVADTSEFWACPPGNSAYRSPEVSYFINVFCSTVDQFGDKEDYATIVSKVNKKMTDHPKLILKVNGMNQRVCLASYHEACLTKNLRFFEDNHVSNWSHCKSQLKKPPIVALIVFLVMALILVLTISIIFSQISSTDSNQPSSSVSNEFSQPSSTVSIQPTFTISNAFSKPILTSSSEFLQPNLTDSPQPTSTPLNDFLLPSPIVSSESSQPSTDSIEILQPSSTLLPSRTVSSESSQPSQGFIFILLTLMATMIGLNPNDSNEPIPTNIVVTCPTKTFSNSQIYNLTRSTDFSRTNPDFKEIENYMGCELSTFTNITYFDEYPPYLPKYEYYQLEDRISECTLISDKLDTSVDISDDYDDWFPTTTAASITTFTPTTTMTSTASPVTTVTTTTTTRILPSMEPYPPTSMEPQASWGPTTSSEYHASYGSTTAGTTKTMVTVMSTTAPEILGTKTTKVYLLDCLDTFDGFDICYMSFNLMYSFITLEKDDLSRGKTSDTKLIIDAKLMCRL